ncbi:hypothetical protein DCAR_0104289 [Daucus carota subsp. sativus]|uniref:CLAVATA3/ESR (CLE)-related protein n=1 Tax=Daucus carota subsp. sativus TaxID=79200 RepID=A0AAF0W8A2_DAUCS|nr:hypothetical protein DCAR_0104289 [Daucus carota subsp. sativus]
MNKLRFQVCLLLFLIIFSGSEARPLSPPTPKKNLSAPFEAIFKTAIEASKTVRNPQRSAPGGPDPQHH